MLLYVNNFTHRFKGVSIKSCYGFGVIIALSFIPSDILQWDFPEGIAIDEVVYFANRTQFEYVPRSHQKF